MKTVKELFDSIDHRLINVTRHSAVKGLCCDSRIAKKGDLFIAVRGDECDGHDYVKAALQRDISCVCSERVIPGLERSKFIIVKDTGKILPVLASRFFDAPSRFLRMIGITGTNGKTTTSYLVYEVLKKAGKSPSLLGSIQYRVGNKILESNNTTPGCLALQSLLKQMRGNGADYVVMEVSSHALKQSRVAGIDFKVAVLTNITGDHLDYHKTMRDYTESKRMLFESLRKNSSAVLNKDEKTFDDFKKSTQAGIISYGIENRADFSAARIKSDINGSRFFIDTPVGTMRVRTPLIGRHNIYNILATAAVSFVEGIEIGMVVEAMAEFKRVRGRLESIEAGQRFKVFVDYAHTHDALEKVLLCLRQFCRGKMVVVFGCGGNRDRTKRPKMGKIASELADYVILSNDNPRNEDPAKILREIENGFRRGFKAYKKIPDRTKAIEEALADRSALDIVLIAGKGHEDCQIVGDKAIPFNDGKVAEEILSMSSKYRCSKR